MALVVAVLMVKIKEKPKVIYKIPCKNCNRIYNGETGKPLNARVKQRQRSG